MKRIVLPLIGILAAIWAAYSVVRTQPRRAPTDPPSPPAMSDFTDTVAAVGLIEASTENIWIGTPLPGVVEKVLELFPELVRAAGTAAGPARKPEEKLVETVTW